ncbi:mechanosensitive ion channel domain-containing protein [uncultured Cocleimonas sp.]|uniref:mechanosensitive ion channel domain-containing protein n=1 Tax=uncultured Cocleimonas sp. TaxID=1051587 RepID=UPI002637C062|nr:mechanosensitive ion channel domain-containing protein [uncultured Cocleimonas sp.]
MRNFQRLFFFITAFLLLVASFTLFAETKNEIDLQKSFDNINTQFERLKRNDGLSRLRMQDIDEVQKSFPALDLKLDECISNNTTLSNSLKENIKVLGDSQSGEESDIKTKRKELETQQQNADNELKRCSLLKIQLKEIIDTTSEQRLDLLKEQLLSKETSIWSAIKRLGSLDMLNIEKELETIFPLTEKFYNTLSWPLLLLVFAGIGLGLLWRRNARPKISKEKHSSPTLLAAIRGIRRTSPALITFLFIFLYMHTQDDSQTILIQFIRLLLILSLAFAILRGLLFPDRPFSSTPVLSRSTILLLVWGTILFSGFCSILNNFEVGRFSDSITLYLIWLVSFTLGALSFIALVWLAIRSFFINKSFTPTLLIPIASMAIAIFAAFFGYRNFATLLYFGTLLSMIVLIFGFTLMRISSEVFDSLDQGKLPWQKKIRMAMSIEDNRAFPGVIWLRILFFFAVLFTSISALMFIWGSSQQRISSLLNTLKTGINVGSMNFDVLNIVYALLVLIVALGMLPFIKNQLVTSWLKHSNLSRGAKEATQTLVGYVGVAIAILWALFILGVNFQNIAIIAGALSVGIGFGLQNIVNNFVSGLILLFERPIRRGDWVVVGSTEGYVRDISIRSTTIQTFNRADVIVPNSELISNQVTNWMLTNNVGRLVAPVGVAYGSDVDKVIEILKSIAAEHPDVIADQPDYRVRALFLEFGDSSLNFELRCYVRNVDERILIHSDINLSIDKAFREAGIEIPFPQRVVHMQNEDKDKDETS